MLKKFIIRLVANAVSLWFSAWLFEYGFINALHTTLQGKIMFFLLLSLVFTLINMFIKPVLQILSLPLVILTLGLFTVVINGLVVIIAWQLAADYSLGWVNAIATGLVISLVNLLITNNLEG